MKSDIPRRTFLSHPAHGVAALGPMTARPGAGAPDGKSPAAGNSSGAVTVRDSLQGMLFPKDGVKRWPAHWQPPVR